MLLQNLLDQQAKTAIGSIPELRGLDVEEYLRRLNTQLGEYIKKAICCYGLTQIDEPDEQKKIADKITEAIGDAIPAPYKLAWPILKPAVHALVLYCIQQAANQGAVYCQGVSCELSPIPLTTSLANQPSKTGP